MSSLKFGGINGPKSHNSSSNMKGIKEIALYDAIKNFKTEEVKTLLSENNFAQRSKDNYLNKAIKKVKETKSEEYLGSIKHLLEYKANLDFYSSFNNIPTNDFPDSDNSDEKETTFLLAISIGNDKLTDLVLEYVKDINMKDSFNRNAFWYLIDGKAHKDNIPYIERQLLRLMDKNINLNEANLKSGHYPITYAASKNLGSILELLLNYGVNPNSQHLNERNTALHYAIKNRNISAVKMLVDKGGDYHIPNGSGESAINYSISQNETQIYHILAEAEEKRIENSKLDIKTESNKINVNESSTLEKNLSDLINTNKEDGEMVIDSNKSKKSSNINSQEISKKSLVQVNVNSTDSFKRYQLNLSGNGNHEISIDIPCMIKNGEKSNSQESTEKNSKVMDFISKKYHNKIEMSANPIVHIDLSDEDKAKRLISENEVYDLRNEILNKDSVINFLNHQIERLNEQHLKDEKSIMSLCEKNFKQDQIITELNMQVQMLLDKNKALEGEIEKLKNSKSEGINSNNQSPIKLSSSSNSIQTRTDYLEQKCLTKDLIDYREFIRNRVSSLKGIKDKLIMLVKESVKEAQLDYEVNIFGSHATGLCLHWSDIDFVLSPRSKVMNISSVQALSSVYKVINNKTWKKSCILLDNTSVPIIKIKTSYEFRELPIDISVQDGRHQGQHCVDLVSSLVKEYEVLEYLVIALKNLIKNAKLNDPYLGGLSSYAMILMIVEFIQIQKNNNLSTGLQDLGRIFLGFLDYYGKQEHKTIITADIPGIVITKMEMDHFMLNNNFSELLVMDPLDHTNNVAKNVRQFQNIKMAFFLASLVSIEDCECECHYNRPLSEIKDQNSEHCILKRIFKSVKRL